MNDFFSRLAARSRNLGPRLEPRLPSRFESPAWEESLLVSESGFEIEALTGRTAVSPRKEPDREAPAVELSPAVAERGESHLVPSPTPSPPPGMAMSGKAARQEVDQTGEQGPDLRVPEPAMHAPQSPSQEVKPAPKKAASHLMFPEEQDGAASILLTEASGGHLPPDQPPPPTPERREMNLQVSPVLFAPPKVSGHPAPIPREEDSAQAFEPGSGRLIRPMVPPLLVPKEAPMPVGGEAVGPANSPPPTISVSIGRIEIKAIPPTATPASLPRKAPAVMTLDDYLRQRHRGENR